MADRPDEETETDAASLPSSRANLAWLATTAGASVLFLFLVWEWLEGIVALDDATAHLMHYARGISTSLITAGVVVWTAWRQHRREALELVGEVERRTLQADEASTLLRTVVDNVPAAMMVLDRHYRVLQANRLALQVHGEDIVGHHCFERLHCGNDRCTECPARETFATGAPRVQPAPHTDPRTGEVLSAETHLLSLPDGSQRVLLVERVLTEQRKMQARLIHQEKMAAFGLMAAGMAHEMGNPLASVEAQLQLLEPRHLPGEASSVMAIVQQEVRRLQRILRELVDFARRRRDEAALVSVQGVVEDALRLLRHDPRMRHVTTQVDFDPETPPVFMVEDHLMQVVLNILINALDAMPQGGRVRIDLRPIENNVALRVHDTGIGLEPDALTRCFEPLFTTKAPGKGTGLGLSISRDILRESGGDIELHGAPARGATAVVVIPQAAGQGILGVAAAPSIGAPPS